MISLALMELYLTQRRGDAACAGGLSLESFKLWRNFRSREGKLDTSGKATARRTCQEDQANGKKLTPKRSAVPGNSEQTLNFSRDAAQWEPGSGQGSEGGGQATPLSQAERGGLLSLPPARPRPPHTGHWAHVNP